MTLELVLEGAGIASLCADAALPSLRRLNKLNVSLFKFDDDSAEALASTLRSLTQLTSLSMSCGSLRDEGMSRLAAAASSLPLLASLYLDSDPPFGEAAAAPLAMAMPSLPLLASLEIFTIEDDALVTLADALPSAQSLSSSAFAVTATSMTACRSSRSRCPGCRCLPC